MILQLLLLAALTGSPTHGARTFTIIPEKIGKEGAEIRITGTGFTAEQYNYEEDSYDYANEVKLIGKLFTYDCDIIQYMMTNNSITCNTGPLEPGIYKVYVYVARNLASKQKYLYVYSSYAPVIKSISPPSGPVGSLVTFYGNFFAFRYGEHPNVVTPETTSVSLRGITFGPKPCNLLIDGMTHIMNTEIKCIAQGSHVGNYDAVIDVQSPHGKSWTVQSAMRVSAQDTLYSFQTFPVIESISPSKGSIKGGTDITIVGSGFDLHEDNLRVQVGGENCTIREVQETKIICTTSAVTNSGLQPGGRGLIYKGDDSHDVTHSHSSEHSFDKVIDGATISADEDLVFTGTTELSGLFRAPHNGQYQFTLHSDGASNLSLSKSIDPNDKELIASNGVISKPVYLKGKQMYYMEATRKPDVDSISQKMRISMVEHENYLSSNNVNGISTEKHTFEIRYSSPKEMQIFNFSSLNNEPTWLQIYYRGGLSIPKLLDWKNDTLNKIKLMIGSVFSPTCNITTSGHISLTYDYDGDITANPFCGTGATNPHRKKLLWEPVNMRTSPYMCFAYRGTDLTGQIILFYQVGSLSMKEYRLDIPSFEKTNSWTHTCVNVWESIFGGGDPKESVSLNNVEILSDRSAAYVDSLSFSFAPVKVDREVRPYLEADFWIGEVKVTDQGGSIYRVSLRESGCKSGYSLLGVVKRGDTPPESLKTTLEKASFAEFKVDDSLVTVRQYQKAVRTPQGTFGLRMYDREVTGLKLDLTASRLENILGELSGRKVMEVTEYPNKKCNIKIFTIIYSPGTNYPAPTILLSDLKIDQSMNFRIKFTTVSNGGLIVNDLGGDFFRTLEIEEVVALSVNDIWAVCHADHFCHFSHDVDSTPSATSLAYTEMGDGGTLLTLQGELFSQTVEDNLVTVGRWPCKVKSSTSTEILCVLPPIGAGVHNVSVTVLPLGLADQPSGVLTFTQDLEVNYIFPDYGSIAGGTIVVISGAGLLEDEHGWNHDDHVVLIGSAECEVISASFSNLECITGPKGSAGLEPVKVIIGEKSVEASQQFNYSTSVTATVTSLSSTTSSVFGGDALIISGEEFGYFDNKKVELNGKPCEITAWSDTQITCTVPPNAPGIYSLKITIGSYGYADVSLVGAFTYDLKVTHVSIDKSSVMAGQDVEISVSGLECPEDMSIRFGEAYVCDIDDCSSSKIKCSLRKVTHNHLITNNGKHPTYGIGNAWDTTDLEIESGDTVTFRWHSQSLKRAPMGIWQLVSVDHPDAYDPEGFNSGPASMKGTFNHTFYTLGDFYYSGPKLPGDFFMQGKIRVLPPKQQKLDVEITIGDYVAVHELSQPVDSSLRQACQRPNPINYKECDQGSLAGFTTDKFSVDFNDCYTPKVDIIKIKDKRERVYSARKSFLFGYPGATLQITGEGFGSEPCQNEVRIGLAEICNITSCSETNIICQIPDTLLAFTKYKIHINVAGRGSPIFRRKAYSSLDFVQKPFVSHFSPTVGSTAGGFLLTISGAGFVSRPGTASVSLSGVPCKIHSLSYSKITCHGGRRSSDERTRLNVRIAGREVDYADNIAAFLYTSDNLPNITDATVQNPVQVQITGHNFGENDSVEVLLRRPHLMKRSVDTRQPRLIPTNRIIYKPVSKVPLQSFLMRHASSAAKWMVAGRDSSHDYLSRSYDPENIEYKAYEAVEIVRRVCNNKETILEEPGIRKDEHLVYKDTTSSSKYLSKRSTENKRRNFYEIEEGHDVIQRDLDFSSTFFQDNKERRHFSTNSLMAEADYREAEVGHQEVDDTTDAEEDLLDEARNDKECTFLRETQYREIEEEEERGVDEDHNHEFPCEIQSISNGSITCLATSAESGTYAVVVNAARGDAINQPLVFIPISVSSVSPDKGNPNGGNLITISGYGFHADFTVLIGTSLCRIQKISSNEISCLTPAGTGNVGITVGDDVYNDKTKTFTYGGVAVPTLLSAQININVAGNVELSITGSNLPVGPVIVSAGSDTAEITAEEGSVTAEFADLVGGEYAVQIYEENVGYSNVISVQIPITLTSFTPTTGGLLGGLIMQVSGSSFGSRGSVSVTVCGRVCVIEDDMEYTSSKIECVLPSAANTDATSVVECPVKVTSSVGGCVILPSGFTYDPSLEASITMVTPSRGGTAGGTMVTILGSGFANSENSVTIDGSQCDIQSESQFEIVCITSEHTGTVEAPVLVNVPDKGYASVQGNQSSFYYIDRWSSVFTWGEVENNVPGENSFVVIPKGTTVLLDTSTDLLSMLLIKGGHVIFDKEHPELMLRCKYILIVEGGSLTIGTESEPYQNKATIELHGHTRSIELPIYGAKVLAVREGTLDLHGRRVPITWTHLNETAYAGSSTIHLKQAVDWVWGDKIIIATTGKSANSIRQSEEMEVFAVSEDGFSITLTEPLKYNHISMQQTIGGQVIETRGEVGLLTRNVRVVGDVNDEFLYDVPECPYDYKPGQFAVQSCFEGKFGAEQNGDAFGATIMLAAKKGSTGGVVGRFSFVEVTSAGQAFRMGRYPIHFHLLGDVRDSYVRGCAIHHSFNRAIAIHGVDRLLVEHNVAYDIKGHAYFMEDGNEKLNTIQYNLGVLTLGSSSLLNTDATPATFWITNPANRVRHNTAVGGSHHGFWYRISKHPGGPSFNSQYCSYMAPLKEFFNNTVHTMGEFGLWIFGRDSPYSPHNNNGIIDTCNDRKYNTTTAKFSNLLAWRCRSAAELVNGHGVQFDVFTLIDNRIGMEMSNVGELWGSKGPGMFNSMVVGSSLLSKGICTTEQGIVTARRSLMNVDNVAFYNFDKSGCVPIRGCSSCKADQVGFQVQFQNLTFENCQEKARFKWLDEHVFIDTDGSLTGMAPESKVIPQNGMLPPNNCTFNVPQFSKGTRIPVAVCDPSVNFIRAVISDPRPLSLMYKHIELETIYGKRIVEFNHRALSFGDAWEVYLLDGHSHIMAFHDSKQVISFTYTLRLYRMVKTSSVLISHNMIAKPDKVSLGGAARESVDGPLSMDKHSHGAWTWDENKKLLTYLAYKKTVPSNNTFEGRQNGESVVVKFEAITCGSGCGNNNGTNIVTKGKPGSPVMWSNMSAWESVPKGFGGYDGTLPKEGDDVIITADKYVILDIVPPSFMNLYVDGILEIADTQDNIINVTHCLIRGGTLKAGKPEQRFTHQLTFLLRGNYTDDMILPGGIHLGAKAIGVFGKLDLHGTDVGVSWTKLEETVTRGETVIKLRDQVTWKPGQFIIITTTSYEPKETEKRLIKNVTDDGRTITITESLNFPHLGETHAVHETFKYDLRAEVALLSRNIRIEGETDSYMLESYFGGHVLVGSFSKDNTTFTGSAHFSNVEFYHVGQKDLVGLNHPGFSLAFIGLDNAGSSSVTKCSFNFNHNAAIFVRGSNYIDFKHNVVYRTIDNGIIDGGKGNKWIGNLVTMTMFGGTLDGRKEEVNTYWGSSISIKYPAVVKNNAIAGGERTGYRIGGNECGSTTTYMNNEAHAVLHGITVRGSGSKSGCLLINNFLIWRAFDYGMYFNVFSSIKVANGIIVDCGVGILPMVVGPNPVKHQYKNKLVEIVDSVFVGRSPSYNCTELKGPEAGTFQAVHRSQRTPSNGLSGIMWPNFVAEFSRAPERSTFDNPSGYMALRGNSTLTNVTFVGYRKKCNRAIDRALILSSYSEDVNFPILADHLSFYDVEERSKLLYLRPKLGSINPSNCVDFDCDGLKRTVFRDKDGTFTGDMEPGTIIPEADYEWDGDPRRGLGDYRLPKTVITDRNGKKLDINTIAPHTGIYGSKDPDKCTWVDDWNAYKCHKIEHRMMIIESMDRDTEDRRLSPVAVLVNPRNSSGHRDLINGPQDVGWCSGYTCQQRLSTFFIVTALNELTEVTFSSTNPAKSRIHLLADDENEEILLKIYFHKNQRYDIYLKDVYIFPENAIFINRTWKFEEPKYLTHPHEFIPKLQSSINGANYYDRYNQFLYLVVRGNTPIDIVTQQKTLVRMGVYVSDKDFYDQNLIDNLAFVLDITDDLISVVNATKETAVLRSEDGHVQSYIEYQIEIVSDPPRQALPPEEEITTILQEHSNHTDAILSKLIDSMQTNMLKPALGVEDVSILQIEKPLPLPKDPPENLILETSEEADNKHKKLYSKMRQEEAKKTLKETMVPVMFEVVHQMTLCTQPGGAIIKDSLPLQIQPKICIEGANGQILRSVGHAAHPWKVRAYLQDSESTLEGNTVADIINGMANFTDLAISGPGKNKQITFSLEHPSNLNLQVVSHPLIVVASSLVLRVSHPRTAYAGRSITPSIYVRVWDSIANTPADPHQQPYTWACEITKHGEHEDNINLHGEVLGETKKYIYAGQTEVFFDNVVIDKVAQMYFITLTCVPDKPLNTPPHVHELKSIGVLESKSSSQVEIVIMQFSGHVHEEHNYDNDEFKIALSNGILDVPLATVVTEIHILSKVNDMIEVEVEVYGTPLAIHHTIHEVEEALEHHPPEFSYLHDIFQLVSIQEHH